MEGGKWINLQNIKKLANFIMFTSRLKTLIPPKTSLFYKKGNSILFQILKDYKINKLYFAKYQKISKIS